MQAHHKKSIKVLQQATSEIGKGSIDQNNCFSILGDTEEQEEEYHKSESSHGTKNQNVANSERNYNVDEIPDDVLHMLIEVRTKEEKKEKLRESQAEQCKTQEIEIEVNQRLNRLEKNEIVKENEKIR